MHETTTPLTAKSAFGKLKAAGYSRQYIQKLLPDWWDNSLLNTSAGSFQFAMILRQRLGVNVSFSQDGELAIQTVASQARFKHRRDTQAEELNVAANLGLALCRMAIHCTTKPYEPLPSDPQQLWSLITTRSKRAYVDFEGLLDLCWAHGVPVLFLKDLPRSSKRMAGMAVRVNNRPVIVLGFNHAQHARQLFVLAHELGHIQHEHIDDNGILIDEDIAEITDTLAGGLVTRKDKEELEADNFALALIRNGVTNPLTRLERPSSAATLASSAMLLGNQLGIDPGHLILSYANENDDWVRANNAMNFSKQRLNALELMNEKFLQYSELSALSNENAEHILAVQGFNE